MDRCKAKEKLKYVDKLDAEPRSRYMNKLTLLNGFDPYDSAKKDWSQDANTLPPLLFGDTVSYLVFGRSAYTWDEFKSYKSLKAHNQFTNGWVHELNIYYFLQTTATTQLSKLRSEFFLYFVLK